jgi:hypothetical protein
VSCFGLAFLVLKLIEDDGNLLMLKNEMATPKNIELER